MASNQDDLQPATSSSPESQKPESPPDSEQPESETSVAQVTEDKADHPAGPGPPQAAASGADEIPVTPQQVAPPSPSQPVPEDPRESESVSVPQTPASRIDRDQAQRATVAGAL